jgi:hypothetical protein
VSVATYPELDERASFAGTFGVMAEERPPGGLI